MPILNSAPCVGIIDDSNNLTLSWTPVADLLGSYSDYAYWNITVIDSLSNSTTYRYPSSGVVTDPSVTQTFTQVLYADNYTATMEAYSAMAVPVTNPWETGTPPIPTPRAFPDVLTTSMVAFSPTSSVLLGQTLTVALSASYTGADQWQILWPDNTSTGWLPLSARSVAKIFSVAGTQNIIVQTRRDYSASQYNPSTSLIRQVTLQIFVVNQQATSTSQQAGLAGDLGIGGQQGFEIVDASSSNAVPNPWEVIARAFVRDTVTNELKLLVATTRFPNASSLLGTMAVDVFPVEGRPHSIELITPPFNLTTTSGTESTLVKIGTSALPTFIVGKTVAQATNGSSFSMTVKTNDIGPIGTAPFLWSSSGLPNGLTMSTNGVITGTPLELGQFSVVFTVQDSSTPPSIDEVILPLTVVTDLLVEIAPGQYDAQSSVLSQLGTTLGVAKVGTRYSVQMMVGNTNTTATSPGGLPPYQWIVPSGLPIGLDIDINTGIISGVPCTYNSTTDYSKTYTAVVQVTDAIGAKATQTYTMTLIPAVLQFGQADQGTLYASQDFKLAVPIFGGRSPYTFDIFSVPPSDSSYYVVSSPPAPPSIIDGQVEVLVDAPPTGTGRHTFTLTAHDSLGAPIGPTQISYNVGAEISSPRIIPAFVSHYWGANDVSADSLAITGDFSGYTLGAATLTPSNGLTVEVDPTIPQVDITGPATAYKNSQLRMPLDIIVSGVTTPAAVISREYTLLAHDDTASSGDIGLITTTTRPYIVGDSVSLNPRKPYFNSPNIPAFNISPNTDWTARVQVNSSLPPGLSLDANTGLIYGVLAGIGSLSTIEYVNPGGVIHGTVTIIWTTLFSDFPLIDNFVNADGHQIGVPFANTVVMTAPTGITLNSPAVVYGSLPAGVSISISGTSDVVFSGTPTEAGYFDLWFGVGGTGNQTSYLYHRLAINYVNPLAILTSLPNISDLPYSTTLQGYGGITPYTWTSSTLPSGLSLTTGGVLSGTLSPPPASDPSDFSNLTFTMTDYRTATVSKVLNLHYDNVLSITTPVVPTIPISTPYSFAMTATGGTPPYTWSISSAPSLPSGITFDAIFPAYGTTGAFSGITSVAGYNQSINITVEDHVGAVCTTPYTIKTGNANLAIDTSNVGPINRGVPYQGTLTVTGTLMASVTPPVTWQVAPIPANPNTLYTGLSLFADSGTSGVNGILSGTYAGVPHTSNSYSVRIVAVDSAGEVGIAIAPLNTSTDLKITTVSLPNATVGSSYLNPDGITPVTLTASGGLSPYTWSIDPTSPTSLSDLTTAGLSLGSNTGVISGTSNAIFTKTIIFRVTDSLSGTPNIALATYILVSQPAGLVITTATVTPATSGVPYSFQMQSSGGTGGNQWTITGANPLPLGLSMNSSGLITGTTSLTGYSSLITFTVTDSAATTVSKSLAFAVSAGLTLYSGVDYSNSISTGILGYVAAGQVNSIVSRPNQSFYVVGTRVVSKSVSTIQAITNNSTIIATVKSLTGSVVLIELTGAFNAGLLGSNSLTVSVSDSGVNVTGVFTWVVYNDGTLRIGNNNLPTQLTTP